MAPSSTFQILALDTHTNPVLYTVEAQGYIRDGPSSKLRPRASDLEHPPPPLVQNAPTISEFVVPASIVAKRRKSESVSDGATPLASRLSDVGTPGERTGGAPEVAVA